MVRQERERKLKLKKRWNIKKSAVLQKPTSLTFLRGINLPSSSRIASTFWLQSLLRFLQASVLGLWLDQSPVKQFWSPSPAPHWLCTQPPTHIFRECFYCSKGGEAVRTGGGHASIACRYLSPALTCSTSACKRCFFRNINLHLYFGLVH